jgi:transposase
MKQRKFTEEYKVEAVKLVVDGGISIGQAARDLGLATSTLERWVSKWRRENPQEAPLTISEREELRSLRKENTQLKLERDILKKAAAYFAKVSI